MGSSVIRRERSARRGRQPESVIPAEELPPPEGAFDVGLSAPTRLPVVILVGASGVMVVGYLDHLTGFQLSFSLFYLAPILLGVRFGGTAVGVALSGLGAISWYLADLWSGHGYAHWAIPYWNSAVRLGLFLAVALLFGSLRRSLWNERAVSRLDPLTGLFNRRAFFEKVAVELDRSRRYGRPWCLAYVDLDNFKKLNDQLGHATGDQALSLVAGLLRGRLRRSDAVARMGGDEFALLLPETEGAAAQTMLDSVKDDLLRRMEENRWPVGASVGVIAVRTPPRSAQEVIGRADSLMYHAKRSGKNRVFVEEL